MLKRLLIVMVCLMFVVGCASMREGMIKISEEEIQNVEAGRIVAAKYLKIWPMQSGLIKGALGSSINRLPKETIKAIDELDKMTGVIPIEDKDNFVWDCEESEEISPESEEVTPCDDYRSGYSIGLRAQMLSEVVLEALEKYAPDVLTIVGGLVGLSR